MASKKKEFKVDADIILVDGMFEAHRSDGAFAKFDWNGLKSGVVFGMTRCLFSYLKKHTGQMIVCWDSKPVENLEKFTEYKANRPKKESQFYSQIDDVKRLLTAFGIKQISKAGWEADQLIGMFAHYHAERGERVLIITGDDDMLQLVRHDGLVQVLNPKDEKYGLYNYPNVCLKYGVAPELLAILWSLEGDPSDNIPASLPTSHRGMPEKMIVLGEAMKFCVGQSSNLESLIGKELFERFKVNYSLINLPVSLKDSYEVSVLFNKTVDIPVANEVLTKYGIGSVLKDLDSYMRLVR